MFPKQVRTVYVDFRSDAAPQVDNMTGFSINKLHRKDGRRVQLLVDRGWQTMILFKQVR